MKHGSGSVQKGKNKYSERVEAMYCSSRPCNIITISADLAKTNDSSADKASKKTKQIIRQERCQVWRDNFLTML